MPLKLTSRNHSLLQCKHAIFVQLVGFFFVFCFFKVKIVGTAAFRNQSKAFLHSCCHTRVSCFCLFWKTTLTTDKSFPVCLRHPQVSANLITLALPPTSCRAASMPVHACPCVCVSMCVCVHIHIYMCPPWPPLCFILRYFLQKLTGSSTPFPPCSRASSSSSSCPSPAPTLALPPPLSSRTLEMVD